MNKRITLTLVALFLVFNISKAQISISTISQTYNEDFNSLANTGTTGTVLPTGWFSTVASYKIDDGSSNSGALYSYGTVDSTDRALGTIGSSSVTPSFGVQFVNSTAMTITGITLNFTTEQWRLGQKPAKRLDSTRFSYNVGVDSLNATGWTNFSGANLYTVDTSNAIAAAINGNLALNRKNVNTTISGLTIAPGAKFWLKWTELNVSGSDDGLAIDDLSVSFTGGVIPACVEPANSVTNVVLNATSTTAVSGSFSATSPASDGYVVLLDSNATVPAVIDATTYNPGDVVGTAVVVYSGTNTTFTKSGLVPNTIYHAYVFPYNNSSCSGGPNYKTSAPGNDTTITLIDACPEPTAKPTNLQFKFVDDTHITGQFNKANPAPTGGYVVVYSTSSNVAIPLDSATYSIGDSIVYSSYKSKVAYVGTDSNFSVSGLDAGKKYNFLVVPFSSCGYGPNYLRTSALRDDTTTTGGTPVCAEPDTITGINVVNVTNNSITASFTPSSNPADGYLVVYRKGSSFLVGVDDAVTYTVGQLLTHTNGSYIDSSYVGYIGTNTTFTLNGLQVGANYYFAVFPYNNTSCTGGPNYKVKFTNNVNKTSATTTGGACVEPNAVPQNLVFNNVTSSTISGHFKQQTIADGYVVVVATGYIANLRDSVNYAVGDSVGNSPKTYVAKIATSNTDTAFTIAGLAPNTSYGVAVYSYKNCSGYRLYKSQIVPNVNKSDTTTTINSGVKYNQTEAAFSIYPNPTNNGTLFVKFDRALKDDAVIEVIDVLGRKISQQKIANGIVEKSIDVSSFAKGTYILNVIYKGTNNVSSFIVE